MAHRHPAQIIDAPCLQSRRRTSRGPAGLAHGAAGRQGIEHDRADDPIDDNTYFLVNSARRCSVKHGRSLRGARAGLTEDWGKNWKRIGAGSPRACPPGSGGTAAVTQRHLPRWPHDWRRNDNFPPSTLKARQDLGIRSRTPPEPARSGLRVGRLPATRPCRSCSPARAIAPAARLDGLEGRQG
ncbi:hypothetical protein ACPA9J_00145 [Pseudomonas aeruginosa]